MDHSHMDHGDMDMGGGQCSMNMLFTWSTNNLCIVFRQWRITGTFSLVLSLIAIVLLTAGYECIREVSRRYEQSYDARMSSFGSVTPSGEATVNEPSSYLLVGKDTMAAAQRNGTIMKGLLYAVQVFYSFFIMLLFMTYNGWIMLSVAIGAFIGYVVFGRNLSSTKSVACH